MTDEELDEILEDFAAELMPVVQAQLDVVAEQFADDVEAATELVAAAYSVSSIRALWNARVPTIMTRLRSIFRRSAMVTAEDLSAPVPTPEQLDDELSAYGDAVEPLLETVGDSLSEAAQRVLAEGVNNGDSLEQLKARLITAFADTGSQLGPVRADRIAQTEAVRAFNAGVLAAAAVIAGPDRPLVKQWVTRHDAKVRTAHRDADGQIQLLADPFDVGGFEMQYPGDPVAPADLTINCRCVLKTSAPTERTASMAKDGDGFQSTMPPQLKRYWLTGPGAAKIGWGTPGSFDRCVRELRDEFPQDPEGLCANLYHEATGRWPGQKAAASGEHTGAMIALMPSAADAARLAALSSEAEDQLHLTLFYLGEASDWSAEAQAVLIQQVERSAAWLEPVRANAFGVAQWNPGSDSPAYVWNVGDDLTAGRSQTLQDVRQEVQFALADCPAISENHSPWAPHVCAAYGDADVAAMTEGCGPVLFDRIRVGFAGEYSDFQLTDNTDVAPVGLAEAVAEIPVVAPWSTPGDTALAFENQQTGDSRVFVPGALYWDGDGPWPLMANENFDSHENASLAGAIHTMGRDGGRITGDGILYLTQEAGYEAALLLQQGAPLGVSVDLDDVSLELVDATGGEAAYKARMLRASLLPMPDGGFFLKGEMAPVMTASATATVTETKLVTFTVGPDGTVPATAFELRAAAGDPDAAHGTVVDTQRSGDYLMRIIRARVRGATLVLIPAYAAARITLDDSAMFASDEMPYMDEISAAISLDAARPYDTERQAATWADRANLGNNTDTDYARVLRHVRSSKTPVGPARVAQRLSMPVAAAQRLLALAASRGEVVRLTRGLYTDKTTSAKADHVMRDDQLAASGHLVASVTGAVDLPVASRDLEWDGNAAEARVFEWADGDCDKISRAFAYRDDAVPCEEHRAYKLGYADVVDGTLTIIPRGVFAAEAAVNGARGGVDIPADEMGGVRDKLAAVRAHVDEETGGTEMDEMQSSAWAAMADLPAMPAAWFREPTADELPSGGAGVNYSNGRIFGWVAQANEPHAGYAKRIVINDLGRIDTTHFLRQRFTLDDGSTVKAGAFTMNAGHHRDGAECETASCQFDDTRTVAGIVTVGMNERGMWFSGAAAPWLSEWDRSVFMATQPSYHMKQGANGNWQLRAVLAVPVPGHSSPLLASAVVERAQLALTAAATMAEVDAAVAAEEERQAADELIRNDESLGLYASAIDYDRLADSMVAALARAEDRRKAEAAELEALLSEAAKLIVDTTDEGK